MNQKILIGLIVGLVLAAGAFAVIHHHNSAAASQESAGTSVPVNQLLTQAAQYEAQGNLLGAKQDYDQIINNYPDYDKIQDVQDKLGVLNIKLIFSPAQIPSDTISYEVVPGDSLGKLAAKYHTTVQLIKRANGLTSDVIRAGEMLRIWTAPFTVLVNKSQNVLFLKSGGEVLKIYRVSTGKDNTTPVGTFKIATKIENPVWFRPNGAPVPAESPQNELGTRWMGFNDPHYGLHGTIHPDEVGQQATEGCVRMDNKDVEELFDILPVGTEVDIQN
ncbi:MAG: L,D-transpeptidase family protein [Candidatus Omnitrophica bacterium]|nr:L,D-transpeptidase family protein [Candidatus Omnitrophota bacterium]MDE2009434.1 L,D-transpeptidase family protein [Candidatus Omnitrophota bacterium]MDE2214645.1 L,D-transpeptidase family protein [Candidatus Omnitrophota bacterium]MDE2231812.1 L,D-transpeptidase family protein [Candidatus Omnitrophota bacterium]